MILRRADWLGRGGVVKLELPDHGVDTWQILSVHAINGALFLKLESEEGGFTRAVELLVSDLVEIIPD